MKNKQILLLTSFHHILADGFHALAYPLLPVIAADLKLSYAQASLVRASFNTSSAALQVPAGMLAERFGECTLMVLGNAWLAAGLLSMGLVRAFYPLLGAAVLGGLGGNTQHPVGTSLISKVYDGEGRGQAIGTLNFSGDIGKLIAPPLVAFAATAWGYRTALVLAGIVGLASVLLLWLWSLKAGVARIAPPARAYASTTGTGHGGKGSAAAAGRASSTAVASGSPDTLDGIPRAKTGGRRQAVWEEWGIKAPIALATLVMIGVLDSSVRGSTLTLLPFILDKQGFDTRAVSGIFTVIFAGGATGKFLCGWIGDRFGTLAVIWGTEAVTALAAVMFLVIPTWGLVPLALAFGFALNGTSSVLYAAVAPLVTLERRARAYGIYYTATISASALSPVLYGALGDRIGLIPSFTIAAAVTLIVLPLSLCIRRYL